MFNFKRNCQFPKFCVSILSNISGLQLLGEDIFDSGRTSVLQLSGAFYLEKSRRRGEMVLEVETDKGGK